MVLKEKGVKFLFKTLTLTFSRRGFTVNESFSAMNVYKKIQAVRVAFQNKNIKQSGVNKFANYKYFELGDITPVLNNLLLEYGLTSFITFTNEMATLTVVNCDNPSEQVVFTSPMRTVEIKGCNNIQALGGIETYQRRYLYMIAFDIVETDFFEAQRAREITDDQIRFITAKTEPEKLNSWLQKLKIGDIKQLSYLQAEQLISKLRKVDSQNV